MGVLGGSVSVRATCAGCSHAPTDEPPRGIDHGHHLNRGTNVCGTDRGWAATSSYRERAPLRNAIPRLADGGERRTATNHLTPPGERSSPGVTYDRRDSQRASRSAPCHDASRRGTSSELDSPPHLSPPRQGSVDA